MESGLALGLRALDSRFGHGIVAVGFGCCAAGCFLLALLDSPSECRFLALFPLVEPITGKRRFEVIFLSVSPSPTIDSRIESSLFRRDGMKRY